MDYKKETLHLEQEIINLNKTIKELEDRREWIRKYQFSTGNYTAYFEESYSIDLRLNSLYPIRGQKKKLKDCLPISRMFEKFHISHSYNKVGRRMYKGSFIGLLYNSTIILPLLEIIIIVLERIVYYLFTRVTYLTNKILNS